MVKKMLNCSKDMLNERFESGLGGLYIRGEITFLLQYAMLHGAIQQFVKNWSADDLFKEM